MALTKAKQLLKTKFLGGKTPSGQEILRQKLNTKNTSQLQQSSLPTTGMTTEELLERGKYLASTPAGKKAFGKEGERLYPTPETPVKPVVDPVVPVAKQDDDYLKSQKQLDYSKPDLGLDDTTGKAGDDKKVDKVVDTDTKISTDTKDMTADWQTQFDEMMTKFETAQTESQKKQADIFTKLGETANQDMLDKFEETQKSMSEAYESYFDEQSEYLKELQEQPSMVDQLKQFREEQGLPQMEKQLAGIDQTIMTTEGLLANIEQDIRTRTEGLPVSESAARRLTAMEQKPLTKQMDELLRSRQRAAAGLEAKQTTVEQFMGAQQEEIAKQKEIAQARLGFAGEKAEFKGDIATQSFDIFTKLQDRMIEIDKLQISAVKDEADYKNKLAEMGFDFFTQVQAAKQADIKDQEKFEKELIKIQFENDLKRANPDVKSVKSIEDRAGNVSQVITYTDGSTEVQNLGQIGTGEKGGTTEYSFNNDERGRLIATGLSNSEITQIQSDINTYGKVGEGLTPSQKHAVEQIQKGMTPIQAAAAETTPLLDENVVTTIATLKQKIGNGTISRDLVQKIVDSGTITSGGKKYSLTPEQQTTIQKEIRSFWQAVWPGGR